MQPIENKVVVIGVPSDENSSFMRGAAQGPARIREVLAAGSTNWCAENGINLAASNNFTDFGDIQPTAQQSLFERIEPVVDDLIHKDFRVIALGGDHAITYPILKAYAKQYRPLTLLQLDAHPDLYDSYEGNRRSHACPFARIMEHKLATRLVQIGIRAMTPHQQEQADRFGVEVITASHWRRCFELELTGPVYLSLDLDVCDPAYAPGVSHHEPGGLSTRNVLELIQQLHAPVVGADIVELNPIRDTNAMTAMLAAKFLKEIGAKMIEAG